MRGEASRLSDRQSRDTLAPKLRQTGLDAWRIGNELFAFTQVLDDNPRLERALTDPSRSLEDKLQVLNALVGTQAHPMTMEILQAVVERKWSSSEDIANAVEDFAVDAMMYYADATDKTFDVSVELSRLHSALLNLPVVRAKLYDETVQPQMRLDFLHNLLKSSELSQVTMRLAEHATENLRGRRFLSTIHWLINKFSRHMGRSMVTITTAKALNEAQIAKLEDIYSRKLDHKVHINLVVDPRVMGGMRVQVGNEVTDRTVVAQLDRLRRAVVQEA